MVRQLDAVSAADDVDGICLIADVPTDGRWEELGVRSISFSVTKRENIPKATQSRKLSWSAYSPFD